MMEHTIEQARELYPEIPESIFGSLYRYAEDRIATGGFLKAVLSNNLQGACAQADAQNRVILHIIVMFIYSELPSESWGSPDKVKEWLNK